MKVHTIVPLLFSALAATTSSLPAAEPSHAQQQFILAVDGKAQQPVVIGHKASEDIRQLAGELADYLGRIAGAKFEIKTGNGAEGIVLGTLADFHSPDLAQDLQIRNVYDGKEAYAIRTEGNRVRLIGATELAASHAVFRFLESVGCRWYFPAKPWEILPHRPNLSAALNETSRPAILARRIWWGYGFFDHDRCLKDYQAWARHNRMAASFTVSCGHAWQGIIAANQKTFDSHPEYLALVGGKRQGPQMCVSRPEVRKMALDHAFDHFQRHPDSDMVSLETSDGGGHCECEACRRLGSISDRVFGLANEVAQAVARKHPGKMVGMYAYNDHCEPPSFALEPNVYVQSTAGFIRGKYTFDELTALWPKRCCNMGFYDYLSVWLWDFDMPPGGRGANLAYLARQIPRYAVCGATSVDCESGNNWGVHGLGYYLANRLMWDPKADVKAVLADFFQQAFGPAAEPMRRYWDLLDPGNDPIMSEHLLAMALRDLAEASKLAQSRPDVLARLEHLKQYQHYVRLRWDYDRSADKDRKRTLALAILTHVYRTRYTYMNHWEAIRQDWTPRVAKEFDRPDWSFRDPSPQKPWKVETPWTREETERKFQDDLTRFQPQQVAEKHFSRDLVPGSFKTGHPAASNQRYQGGGRYASYSVQGEPLELTVTTGLIAWYRDRPDARYVFSDPAGKEVATGRLPQDGLEHRLAVPVPRAGLYWLEFDDQAAGWGIAATPGRSVCLALSRSRAPQHMGHMQAMYFYVPKDTKEVQYFWEGGPHEVFAPDGKRVASTTTRGAFVTVPVPPGSDGKVWSLDKLCLGRLWFFNVPNYLAASPESLLLPRELSSGEKSTKVQ